MTTMIDAAKKTFKEGVDSMYSGASLRSRAFRYSLLTFDIATVIFFVVASMFDPNIYIRSIELFIAVVIFLDITAQLLISNRRLLYLSKPTTWIDIAVFISLLLPALMDNFTFLRVIRALRLLRSYQIKSDLRAQFPFFKENEEVIQSTLNLFVFIFTVSAVVYVMQERTHSGINNFLDALYFTITTLTTTGYGDVILQGISGKVLSIIIMVVGVGLFIRLVQTIFRPSKVEEECENCGLSRHDLDAIHCKHCGEPIKIETEGVD